MEIKIDMSEEGQKIGQQFLATCTILSELKQNVESGNDPEGKSAAHLGAFAFLLQNAGLDAMLQQQYAATERER